MPTKVTCVFAAVVDSNEVVVESKELAEAEPAASCKTAVVGEILVSLRVSGSALRGNIPEANLAAAISAALMCCCKSSSSSLMRVFSEMGVVAEVPMVSANECFFTAAINDSLPSVVNSMADLPERLRFTVLSALVLVELFDGTGVWGGLVAGAAEPLPPRQGRQQRNTVLLKHFDFFDLRVFCVHVLLVEADEEMQLPLPKLLRWALLTPATLLRTLPLLLLLLRMLRVPLKR